MLRWAWRAGADLPSLALLGMAIVGNVSLMLYFRQARYYAPMIFFSVSLAYCYWHLQSRRSLIIFSVVGVLLFASNYLAYGAWVIMLTADYVMWGRRRRAIRGRDWLIILGPQILAGAMILAIWNPLRISAGDPSSAHGWFIDRWTLLWRTFRDADRCEFSCSLLVLLAVPVAIWKRSTVLLRALVALTVAILAIDFASPQSPRAVDIADVRYFTTLIPLGIVIGVITLRLACGRFAWIALIVAPLAFFTNWLDVSAWKPCSPRCTPAKFVHELWHLPPDPYTAVIQWMDSNVSDGQSIATFWDYCAYPLMFHEPKALYGWQLDARQQSQYPGLKPIYFLGMDAPDYIILFGSIPVQYQPPPGVEYLPPIVLNVFPKDAFRPELMLRTFEPIAADPAHGEAIFIFRKHVLPSAPVSPAPPPDADFKL